MPTTETRGNKKKPLHGINDPPNARRTSSFVTDFNAKDTGRRPGTGDGQSKPPGSTQNCLCCSGSHELASCSELKSEDLQTRWDIVKHHRLCHVCMRQGITEGGVNPKGSVHVGVISNTTGFFTTPQGETLLKST